MASGVPAAAIGLLALVPAGCRQHTIGSEATAASPPPPTVDQRLIDANTQFAFDLLGELRKEAPEGNVFLSPASIAMALHMTYNGAATTTKEAMAEALAVADVSLDDLNAANRALRQGLEQTGPGVELALANSLWHDDGAQYPQPFMGVVEQHYGATTRGLDFSNPQAPQTIDDWVKQQTKGRIAQITPSPLPDLVVFILVSAAYFKGEWSEPFDKHDTRPGEFHLPGGTSKQVLMMSTTEDMGYLRGEGFQGVHLRYGTGRFGMCILLPDEGSTLDDLIGGLAPEGWREWREAFHETEVHLELPRFRTEWGASLKEVLSALGMEIAFDPPRADFTPMGGRVGALWIHDVLHSTFLQVDEEGTEAAAATEVLMMKASLPKAGPISVIVDRPFLCAIVDNETGTIIFIGAITDPEPIP